MMKNAEFYYTQKANNSKYLYHVSKQDLRPFIEKQGLLPKGKYQTLHGLKPAIFAHDCKVGKPSVNWYPFVMDYIESFFHDGHLYNQFENFDFTRLIKLQGFDIWRIDNHLLQNTWYKDEPMFIEFKPFFTAKPPKYLVSFEAVPREALRLMG
jgi:hypothetical protein